MALHEVDISNTYIKGDRHYCSDMVNEFIENDMSAAEVDVPNGVTASNFRANVYNVIKRKNMADTIKVRMANKRVYLIKG